MWRGRGAVPKPMRIQREGAQLQIRGTWSAGPGDDQARFLADLRALRDSAAIGYDELAARAHYPSDVLKEAENGPSLPGLPILTAYVRACEGDVLDWEERWRRLNPDVPDDPDLPVRLAGASAAAQAGARAGVGVAPPEVYDPERIKAALRGGHARTEQSGRRASDPGVLAPAPGDTGLDSPDPGLSLDSGTSGDDWGTAAVSPGWDPAPDPAVMAANGNHSATLGSRGPFDAAFTSLAEAAEPAPAEDFSWLTKGEPESPPGGGDGDLRWPEQAGNGGSAETADGYGWSGRAETARPTETLPTETLPAETLPAETPPAETLATEQDDSDVTWPNARLASRMAAGSGYADPDVSERILRHQAEGLAGQERTDFWGHPLPQAAAGPRMPAATPRAEEPTVTRASWSAAADTTPPAPPAAEPVHRTAAAPAQPVSTQPVSAQSVSAQPVNTGTSHTGTPQTHAAVRERDHRQDRYFPARLLAVIVIAALIGSALVLLLK
jgi:hypothetical protein